MYNYILLLMSSDWALINFLLGFYTIFFLVPNFKTSFAYKLFNSVSKPAHLPIMRYINLITQLGSELGVRKFLIISRLCCFSGLEKFFLLLCMFILALVSFRT